MTTRVLIQTGDDREALAAWANSLPGQSLEAGTVDYVMSAVLTTSGKWHTLTVVVVLV